MGKRMSYSTIKRHTPVKKKRDKPRRGEPTNEEKQAARVICYSRANGLCQLHVNDQCLGYAPLNAQDDDEHQGQLCHLKSKRRFGWFESEQTGQRHLWGCVNCHRISHCYGKSGIKPCPNK